MAFDFRDVSKIPRVFGSNQRSSSSSRKVSPTSSPVQCSCGSRTVRKMTESRKLCKMYSNMAGGKGGKKDKGKGKVHPRTGHEGPEGE